MLCVFEIIIHILFIDIRQLHNIVNRILISPPNVYA